jgi:NADH-quinone oxidoreductase subunit J
MNVALALIALLILVSAATAMALRNLIHSALLLVLSWFGIAAFYLWAGAEFVAFAQILIYVGAISMVVLFAVLLTRRSRDDVNLLPATLGRAVGAIVAGLAVAGVLAVAVLRTEFPAAPTVAPSVTVRDLGQQLMGQHAAAVLIVGVILTVALLGAVVLASTDTESKKRDAP